MGESTDRPVMCGYEQPPACEAEAPSCGTNDGGSTSSSGSGGLINLAVLSGDNTDVLGSFLSGTTVDLTSLLDGSPISADVADVGGLDLSGALASILNPDVGISEVPTSLLDVVATDLITADGFDIV